MTPIRVCITDDHKLFRKLIKNYLQSFPRIDQPVEEAENGRDLLRKLRDIPVDVVLLDISMPVMGGEEAASIILNRYPNIKIVMLTIQDAPGKILELMNLGVHGYLLKDCEPSEIIEAVQAVIDRDFYKNELSSKALQLASGMKKTSRERMIEELTNREREILLHICGEYTMKEISIKLSISIKTVENHRMNMLQKLSVKNTVGLIKYAYENRLLPLN